MASLVLQACHPTGAAPEIALVHPPDEVAYFEQGSAALYIEATDLDSTFVSGEFTALPDGVTAQLWGVEPSDASPSSGGSAFAWRALLSAPPGYVLDDGAEITFSVSDAESSVDATWAIDPRSTF